METRWLYTTAKDFPLLVERSKKTVIVPVGCVEKHGLHLPMGQDIIQVSYLAYEASKLEEVCVFPDFTFGDVPGAHPAGNIGIPNSTQMLLLEQLCDEMAKSGFEKILLYNGHGGNGCWLNQFMRNMEAKKKPYSVFYMMLKLWCHKDMAKMILEQGSGAIPELTKEDEDYLIDCLNRNIERGHACLGETAYMMGISPESVHMEYLGVESGLNTHASDPYKDFDVKMVDGFWPVDYPNELCGHDPVGCNERMGKASIRLETERLARNIKMLKEDTQLRKWAMERQARLKTI
ncbi:MAG: creatininase family protein [Ruminococcaceae bacterium]|nr:creatininase family protein [Oscillospiraceae bacterium]